MHRRTRIERTSGLSEPAIHALMMAEISVPLLLTLLYEVNPLLLGISAAAAGAHEATAIWDVRSAVDGGREVRPAEQDIHSFLESLPFMAIGAPVPALGSGRQDLAGRGRGRGLAAAALSPAAAGRLPGLRAGRGRHPDRGAVRGGAMALRNGQEPLWGHSN